MAKLLFWISAGFTVYVYIGYPILLWGLQAIFRSSPGQQSVEPSVSLLVAAYNEAAVIADKIRNSLALDYPVDKLEIVIASDGSKDATAEIVRSFAGTAKPADEFVFSTYEKNRGKMAVLNDAVRELRGEIVAFSDASSMLAADSVRILVQSFNDPRVGAASGVYRLLKKDQARLGSQEDLYWKYETVPEGTRGQARRIHRRAWISVCHPPRAVSIPLRQTQLTTTSRSPCAFSSAATVWRTNPPPWLMKRPMKWKDSPAGCGSPPETSSNCGRSRA